jgi:hypothetical protein
VTGAAHWTAPLRPVYPTPEGRVYPLPVR